MEKPPTSRRISSAVACAVAAGRATAAVDAWLLQLGGDERDEIRRRLSVRQEWLALSIFNARVKQQQGVDDRKTFRL